MTKVLHCRDVGMDCDAVIRAETEEEVLAQAAAHAKQDHDMEQVPEEVVAKIREAIREE